MTATTKAPTGRPWASNQRPSISAAGWVWKEQARDDIAGIGLFKAGKLAAHLTYAEARALADQLHDIADELDQP